MREKMGVMRMTDAPLTTRAWVLVLRRSQWQLVREPRELGSGSAAKGGFSCCGAAEERVRGVCRAAWWKVWVRGNRG